MSIRAPLAAMTLGAFALIAPGMRANENAPKLHIIQDSLVKQGNFYAVKGSIYNPYDRGVKNVVIKYYIWKKWMGQDGHGSKIKETGGLVMTTLKYVPPKQSVDFLATGDDNAPVMMHDSPDPLDAVIEAVWDE